MRQRSGKTNLQAIHSQEWRHAGQGGGGSYFTLSRREGDRGKKKGKKKVDADKEKRSRRGSEGLKSIRRFPGRIIS